MRRQAGMRARRAHGRSVKLQQEFTRSRMFVHVPFCPVRAPFFSAAALRYNAPMQSVSREGVYPSASLQPFELVNADGSPRFLIVCDHASNALPEEYGALGLDAAEFGRHIAYDIGAGTVARLLGDYLGCPAVLARFSRLLIDLNRAADDPTLVMKFSDGAIVPANRDVDPFRNRVEFERRIALFHRPYHEAIAGAIMRAREAGAAPILVSIHSFTPFWRGHARPWQAGILWDRDDRLARRLLDALRMEGLHVGDNEPYSGRLKGDCLYRHGTLNGLPHALVEIRQDLIAGQPGQKEWAARLAGLLRQISEAPELQTVRHYGSHAD